MRARIKKLDEIVRLPGVHIVQIGSDGSVQLEAEPEKYCWLTADTVALLGSVQEVSHAGPGCSIRPCPKGEMLTTFYRIGDILIPTTWLEIVEDKPLPCPWCGEKPEVVQYGHVGLISEWTVRCENEDCPTASPGVPDTAELTVGVQVEGSTRDEAIKKWNNRKG